MFQGQDLKDIIIYLLIMGVGLGLFQMIPPALKALISRIRRALRKVEIEELAEELGGVCKNEDECNGKLERAVKSEIAAMGKDIKKDIAEARKESRAGIKGVHERVDKILLNGVEA